MSDLQCAARLLFLSAGDGAAASRLHEERVAAVYDGHHHPASAQATELARTLGVPVRSLAERVSADLVRARDPEAMRVLGEVADLYRGETVVVLTPTEAPFRLSVDGDGTRVESGI
jgi:hypothetical protein